MAKNLEDLQESREIRKQVIDKYGFVPTSVMSITYDDKSIIEYPKRKQNNVGKERHKSMEYDRALTKAFKMSSINVRGNDETAGLSTFPPGLARFITQFYSEKGDTVLDPCAGHNSRMQVVYKLDRNYIGYDVSKEFMQFNREVAKTITGQELVGLGSNCKITLKEKSSEKMDEADESIDLVFTSPPYYCVEYYGNETEQLGLSETYEHFLQRLKLIVAESYRVLKKNKYCVFNINDFRMDGKFYSYHSDVINLFKEVGFTMWDCVIIKWANSIASCFASQIEKRKICAKQHEFLIIGKKICK